MSGAVLASRVMPLHEPIFIYDYEPRWPKIAAQRLAELSTILGPTATVAEHIGSTAVPGLAAKPIIDLIIGAATPGVNQDQIDAITRLGYDYYGNEGVPGRVFFRREANPTTNQPVVHLHIFPDKHPALYRDVSFRDKLRRSPELAHRYGVLKRALALTYRDDLDSYNRGKEDFIVAVAGPRDAPPAWLGPQPVEPASTQQAVRPTAPPTPRRELG